MKHIIIEPHADDAFLSLGGHIERWKKEGEDVAIVTVYSGTRKRAKDAEAYAHAVGAAWYGLGAKERRGGGKPGDGASVLRSWLRTTLLLGRFYCCLAVKHPDHTEVRESVAKLLGPRHILYYLDQPYADMTINSPVVTELLSGKEVVSFLKPHSRKYRHIPLFKDQGRFFYFNPAESLKHNPEVIVRIP